MSLRDRFGASTPSVSVSEALDLLQGDGAVLLDVREPAEWTAGHAPQAVHVPLGELAQRAPGPQHGRTVVVVCRSGNRSRIATDQLRARGLDAVNLAGGMQAWLAAGGPVVDDAGGAGAVT